MHHVFHLRLNFKLHIYFAVQVRCNSHQGAFFAFMWIWFTPGWYFCIYMDADILKNWRWVNCVTWSGSSIFGRLAGQNKEASNNNNSARLQIQLPSNELVEERSKLCGMASVCNINFWWGLKTSSHWPGHCNTFHNMVWLNFSDF